MSSSRSININLGPLGFLSILVFVDFLMLKLGGWGVVASWSWWVVTAPLWGMVALWIGFLIIGFTLVFISELFK